MIGPVVVFDMSKTAINFNNFYCNCELKYVDYYEIVQLTALNSGVVSVTLTWTILPGVYYKKRR